MHGREKGRKMSRRKKPKFEIIRQTEGRYARPGHYSTGYTFYHLYILVRGPYTAEFDVLEQLKELETILGPIPHYNSYRDMQKGLSLYESPINQAKRFYGPVCINSRLERNRQGWVVDLWMLDEFKDWQKINED